MRSVLYKKCLKEWGYRIGLCTFGGLFTCFVANWIKSGYATYIDISINMPLFLGMSLGLYIGLYNNFRCD